MSKARGAAKKPRSPSSSRGSRQQAEGRLALLGSRLTRLWQRLLDRPSLWLVLLLATGTLLLLPPGLFSAREVTVGEIADQDYTAPRDLLIPDDETTRQAQQRAREAVLPVYDYNPSGEVDQQLGALFAYGRNLPAQAEGASEDAAGPAAGGPSAAGSGDRPAAAGQSGGDSAQPAGEPADPTLAERLVESTPLTLSTEVAAALIDKALSPDLEDRLRSLAVQVLRRGVAANKGQLLENRLRGIALRDVTTGEEAPQVDLFAYLSHPEEVLNLVRAEVRDWPGLKPTERRLLTDFLVANLRPNLNLNSSETLARQEAAEAATPPSFKQFPKGQVIVRKGDRIAEAEARAINSYRRSDRRLLGKVLLPLGLVLMLALAALVLWLTLEQRHERRGIVGRQRLFSAALMILLLSLLATKLGFLIAGALAGTFDSAPFDSVRSHTFAIPFAALGLCAALLLGRRLALVLAPLFSLLIGRLAEGGEAMEVVLYSFAGSLAAIYALSRHQVEQRMAMTRLGLVVGGVNLVVILLLTALAGGLPGGTAELAFDLVCAFGGGLLVAAVVSFAVPILESLLGVTTDIKLAELANTNLPLLRRLAYEAPGSFQHSMMVANLAKRACEAIGADASLAYTAGLYHDVGKVFRSEYFIENQHPGHNPHDKLQPTMSALILVSHVKDGVELARKHHLPQPIIDAIEQHHGTRRIKYFYNRACEQCDDASEVSEEKFRYPGPRPQNKVMGVLMLADGVEAASRTLVAPSRTKIRTLIRAIVDDCLQDGQLDETDLTLADLRRTGEAFQRVLNNIFHQRIDYPGFDFNTPAGTSPAPLRVSPSAGGETRERPVAAAGSGSG